MGSPKLTNVLLILLLGVLIYLCATVRIPVTSGGGFKPFTFNDRAPAVDVRIVNEPLEVNVESLP